MQFFQEGISNERDEFYSFISYCRQLDSEHGDRCCCYSNKH